MPWACPCRKSAMCVKMQNPKTLSESFWKRLENAVIIRNVFKVVIKNYKKAVQFAEKTNYAIWKYPTKISHLLLIDLLYHGIVGQNHSTQNMTHETHRTHENTSEPASPHKNTFSARWSTADEHVFTCNYNVYKVIITSLLPFITFLKNTNSSM